MLFLYFAINRRAVLEFFNPFKNEQFLINYYTTIQALHDHDPHASKCLRFIYFILLFEAFFQLYLYLFPHPWHRLIFFDLLTESNNYPSWFKLNFSAFLLLSVYLFHLLYVRVFSENFFKLISDYYMHDSKAFVSTPSSRTKKIVVVVLNFYQIFTIVSVIYLCSEYITFTLRIFRGHSLLVWTQWIEFVCMNIFFVAFASACFLFIFIANTCVSFAVLGITFVLYRFRETSAPLSQPYSRFTTISLLRFMHRNISTMQFIFFANRLYGPILVSFLMTNVPFNVMVAIYWLQNQFSGKQKLFLLAPFLGQLSGIFCFHLVAAIYSKRIHSPFKRFQSLYILINQCPLRARIHLANTIQTFHVNDNQYGITYGSGKWAFGLVIMMSFTKFILLYGEMLMYQYSHFKHTSQH